MFVRTENGIYEVDKLANVKSCITYDGSKIPEEVIERANGFFIENNKLFYRDCWQTRLALPHEQVSELGLIVTKSDTLEELCDEFVGIDNTCENGHQLLRAIPYKCVNFWNGGVYGAIWTDKGLIYVAKMNDKGEWKLYER